MTCNLTFFPTKKISSQNLWPLVLQKLDMQWCSSLSPENLRGVASNVANHYSVILLPFEEVWRRNMQVQEQNRKAQMARQQGDHQPGLGSVNNQQPPTRPQTSNQGHVGSGPASDTTGHMSASTSSPQANALRLPGSPVTQKSPSMFNAQSPTTTGSLDGVDPLLNTSLTRSNCSL